MLLVFLGVPVPSEVSSLYTFKHYEALSPYTTNPYPLICTLGNG